MGLVPAHMHNHHNLFDIGSLASETGASYLKNIGSAGNNSGIGAANFHDGGVVK